MSTEKKGTAGNGEERAGQKRTRKPWSPEARQSMSEYRKAHPQGNRDPAWWTPARKAESLRRMIVGIERKLRETEADG